MLRCKGVKGWCEILVFCETAHFFVFFSVVVPKHTNGSLNVNISCSLSFLNVSLNN